MNRQIRAQFAVLLAMQSKLGIKHYINDDQSGQTKKNGGRPTFKQNRRVQIKKR